MKITGHDLLSLQTYDYALAPDRIAQFPVKPRDASKLLVLDRKSGKFTDLRFREISEYFHDGDVLVLNDTKVIPARIFCDRGEILLVRKVENDCWDTLVQPGKHFKPGGKFQLDSDIFAEVLSHSRIGRLIRFSGQTEQLLERHGKIPLPPYIDREELPQDRKTYQTIYARHSGSVAAPTAGMHFTRKVFQDLKTRRVQISKITLHVGPGTFRPVKTANVSAHQIDPEYYSCSPKTWAAVKNARRVVAVGTTTTRTLETIARTGELSGCTDLFIYPGFEFRVIHGLITNFHLPKSSLLMLVSAFGGYEQIMSAYSHAIHSGYRFYSYGDAMYIL
jgi:S-adenosylmethionine:tRNA ribosyltransferase-isomerase